MNSPENPTDIISFNRLFTENHARFVRFASTYVDDRMAAEDIVMEAMMYYWENRFRLELGLNSSAYIFTAIKNKCLNYLRDKQHRQQVSEQLMEHASWKLSLQLATLEACDPEELFSDEIQQLVNETLERLSETTRRIFVMSRFEEKSHREIAAEMNMSVKGVEYHISKATSALKHALKDFLPILLWLLKIYP
ncbi:RNA polymerase sigma-70 factor [Bacteroides pyogenes]|uniref:RNA polymerase sigma-70 factor n=1 Tax=Bacteroides pyogenes TaxID=310300 RepID=UPI000E15BA1B|nr:RNA polymerase sigma-70 factor [Bacteroides pyogenes]MBB3894486.1 RNA polymerase sigma-70 factor (ECF subfamily) [Bacteroides pyogenes]SUV32365.1 RNA polymerase, sigma-24 subunit, ECF subfamily [Bacteroides pyogenes]